MVQSVIQHSFHAGEWAPALYARVDLAKYKAGAALMENFYVDYRGGASSRPGTEYVIQAFRGNDDFAIRLIPFQASNSVGYVLEFGSGYIRPLFNGGPVFSDLLTITNVAGTTVTAVNNLEVGEWVLISEVTGITNINDKYFIVASATAANFTVTDLFGNPVTFTGTYVSGGFVAPIYLFGSPYDDGDLALVKYTQLVDRMFLTHPKYPPLVLTLIAANNWTLQPIPFGTTVGTPTNLVATTSNAGNGNFLYAVTAVDVNGQESVSSSTATQTINTTSGQVATIHLTWTAVTGAVSYNVYRSPESISATPPAGSSLGYLMNVTGTGADDTFTSNVPNNAADFSVGVPIAKNPFQGAGVASIDVTNAGTYTTVPGVVIDPAPTGGADATGHAVIGVISFAIVSSGIGFSVGSVFTTLNGVVLTATSVDGSGHVLTAAITSAGGINFPGSAPGNPVTLTNPIGGISANLTWGVTSVGLDNHGAGYTSVPNVTFDAGAAAATAILDETSAGNPAVPGLHQQRLVLAARPEAVQTFNMSQPGEYYNFNISSPIQADDAIEASIVSGQLNEIKSMVSVPTGLILLSNKANWLVSAGGQGAAVTPIDIVANAHSYNGANDVPPIIANFDVLFVQNKNSVVRDLTFNFYTQIYTGTDISVLSSHLFYGYQILEWAWAEEPFKVVWAIRDDGVALSLTFLKEQELIGWSHSVTQGLFKSVAVVTEPVELLNSEGVADAVYFVVERVINGNTVKYIERLHSRVWPSLSEVFCVDSGLRYDGPPATTISGAEHLGGATVTGLADGVVIPPFVMPTSGSFTLSTPASVVTIGLAFTCKLQTLPLDIGEPTIAGKRKGINGVTVRVQDALNLQIGGTFDKLVPMKDTVLGNVGSASNAVVTDLVTGDARTIIDPSWTVPGQYCIQQSNPLPATILGVIPEIEIGDTK